MSIKDYEKAIKSYKEATYYNDGNVSVRVHSLFFSDENADDLHQYASRNTS